MFLRVHLALFILALLSISTLSFPLLYLNPTPSLEVSFLDVGQGDAILIRTPSGKVILIDGGPDRSVLRELGSELGFFETKIDVLISTHPDQDHIGGLSEVLAQYEVETVLRPSVEGESAAWKAYMEGVEQEGAKVVIADAPILFDFKDGVLLEILFPYEDTRGYETNDASIMARLVYGDTAFMLTGDAPVAAERYLVRTYGTLESEVLKAGHHGSKTSTSPEFVEAVGPEYGVISAGKDNRYGHPHKEVLDVLEDAKVRVLATYDGGVVSFRSNGEDVWLKTETPPCEGVSLWRLCI